MKTKTISDVNRRHGKVAWLRKDAAKSYERAKRSSVLGGGCVSDAGRTNGEQWAMYNAWLATGRKNPPSVAYPGTSLHETGIALDVREPDRKAMHRFGKHYGWVNPAWAKRSNTYEPWHFEYDPRLDRSKPVKIKVTRTLDAATYRAVSRAIARKRINKPSKRAGEIRFWKQVQRRINLIMKGQKGWKELRVDGIDGPATWDGLRLSLRVVNRVHRPGKNASRRRTIYCWQRALRAGKRNKWSQKSEV